MRINKDVLVAIDLVREVRTALLAGKFSITISSLSDLIMHPEPHLQQISMKLRKAGIITIARGPGGGIVDTAAVVSAFDIMRALEPKNSKPSFHSLQGHLSEALMGYIL